jgi:catechol 2,3-dioxygenase-like lactoylglutathione lyase family enzyme
MTVRPRRIGHVGMVARDLSRMVAFYEDTLGMQVSDRMPYPEDSPYHEAVWMRINADHHVISMFGLRESADPTGEERLPHAGVHHVAFEMQSFEDLRRIARYVREPELKRYLGVAAKRALKRAAGFAVERADQPAFVSLRKEIFAWLLEQPTNEVLKLDEKSVALSESAAFEIARHTTSMEAARKRRRATIEMMFSAHKKQKVRAALATYGVDPQFDADAIAGALYLPVQAWLKTPAALVFLDELIGAFYDAEIARAAG